MANEQLKNALKDNVQGDILGDGFLKQVELFFFFNISKDKIGDFRKKLSQLVPANGPSLIANVRAQQDERSRVMAEVAKNRNSGNDATSQDARDKSVNTKQANIAFSNIGLEKISNGGSRFDINISAGTESFVTGMESEAVGQLQDPPTQKGGNQPKWNDAFLGRKIDGVILVVGNNNDQASQKLGEIKKVLDNTVTEVITVSGSAREGQLRRHEHFGFFDGISEPGVKGFDTLKKDTNNDDREDDDDKELVRPGIVLCGRDGDPHQTQRPPWTLDGSFLAFRWLEQKVPEFQRDLGEKFAPALTMDNTPKNREAIASRIIGRWPSGALITTNPDQDPMPLEKQKTMTKEEIEKVLKVNAHVTFPPDLAGCPLGSHIRKMNPRGFGETFRIVRRGIQFGPEVTPQENANKKTDPNNKRGLLFVCYQSELSNGFHFIQTQWANKENFPGGGAGVDPMVGQGTQDGEYSMMAMNRSKTNLPIKIPFINPYVVPLGGEYFFSPSMDALRNTLADKTAPPGPTPGPTPGPKPTPPGVTVNCFIEDRNSGRRPTANVPIDGQSHKITDLWGPGVTGNFMGVNGSVPNNVVIQIGNGGQTITLPSNQTPVQIGSGGPTTLSQWTISGRQTS